SRRSHYLVRNAELLRPLLPRCMPIAVTVDEQLGAGAEGLVRQRIHVAHDHVRLIASLEECIRTAVDGDQHRLEVADVRPDHPQVALMTGTARNDECMTVPEAR